jgi:hypothetical protein
MIVGKNKDEHEKNKIYRSIKGPVDSVSAVKTGVAINIITS